MITKTEKFIDLEFEVIAILSRNKESNFTVAKIKLLKYSFDNNLLESLHIGIGCFKDINIGDEFKASGEWVKNQEYGYQIKITNSKLLIPKDNKEMISFLTKYVRGIGSITASEIVNKFGNNTYDTILNNPSRLIEIGITEEKAIKLHDGISEHNNYTKMVDTLHPLGFSINDIILIYKRKGKLTIDNIMENPYILCDYCNIDFKLIDKVAKKLDFDGNNPYRIRSGIMAYISKQITNKGHLFIFKEQILKNLSYFLNKYGEFDDTNINRNHIKRELQQLISLKKIIITENNKKEKCVYIEFYEHMENEVVKLVTSRLNDDKSNVYSKEELNKIINKKEQENKFKLDIKQRQAVEMAINNRISILYGGPGTGKTQTINTIIGCIKELDSKVMIELCAPTGRAAKRMTELTNIESKTIHRLIGLNNFNQDRSTLIPVACDYLIIDEASMVDIYMLYSLLSVLSYNTKILIVGDYQQLPSVGPGLILKDFINSDLIPKVELTRIFRQASNSQIIMNSYEIIKGSNNISLDNYKKDFYFLEQTNLSEIIKLILASVERLLNTGFKLEDIQILSPLNTGTLGAIEINKRIQERFNTKYVNKLEIEIGPNEYIRLNDRVIQTINNYELNVFNGEIGIVTKINKGIRSKDNFEIIVNFGDRVVIYDYSNVKELSLAYAITVHKSQGSEFPVVIIPFHSILGFINNRSTIYTAWTRAKDRVICIGDRNELDIGIQNTDNLTRNSMIKEKIKQVCEPIISNEDINNEQINYAYIGFNATKIENHISYLIKDIDIIEDVLKKLCINYAVKENQSNNSKLKELEEVLQEKDKEVLKEYRKKGDKLRKLNKILSFIKDKYEYFNCITSYQIPFTINKNGHGTLKGIQFPNNNPTEILELIDLEPMEALLKSNGFDKNDNIDIILNCYNLEGIELSKLNSMFSIFKCWSLVYLYIGNKLYIAREDASRNNESYDISSSGKTQQLAIIKLLKEKLETLLSGFPIVDRIVSEIK